MLQLWNSQENYNFFIQVASASLFSLFVADLELTGNYGPYRFIEVYTCCLEEETDHKKNLRTDTFDIIL
jgi:hypothetical protein